MNNQNQIAILKAMLGQMKFDDPKFRLFIQQEIREGVKKAGQREAAKEILRRLKIQNKKLLEQVASLKEQLKQTKTGKNAIESELTRVVRLTNLLSNALGSCNICWGEDPGCVNCAGNGSSGWRSSNKRLFNIYILPTLENLYGLTKKIK